VVPVLLAAGGLSPTLEEGGPSSLLSSVYSNIAVGDNQQPHIDRILTVNRDKHSLMSHTQLSKIKSTVAVMERRINFPMLKFK
jgi:hypothetical protein